MPVSTLPSAKEFEEKGWADIEFVGIRYTGDSSSRVEHTIREQAGYNGPPQFQKGETYLALLPTWLDEENIENSNLGVQSIEARTDFEVIYDSERLATALLGRNYLPTDVFYEGFDRYKRRKVMDKLGLEDVGRVFTLEDEQPWRDQLREIAGIERDGDQPSKNRIDEYSRRFPRSDLVAVVKELREDTDEIDLRTAGQTDMAEFLAGFEPETVESAVNSALSDGDE